MTRSKAQGAAWKILSCVCFAGMNAVVRGLSHRLPSETIALFLTTLGLMWLLPLLLRKTPKAWKTNRLDLQIGRAFLACIGVLFWYRSLAVMPMTQAVALNFTGPFITLMGSRLFLGEKLTAHRMVALCIAVLGGTLISNAGYLAGDTPWGSQGWSVLLPLCSASAFSACTLFNKKLTFYDDPLTIVAYSTAFMLPLLGFCALPNLTIPLPEEWGWLALGGLLSFLANFALVRAFVCADLSFLLPLGSVRLIASALMGWFFFGQPSNNYVFAGFLVVLLALGLLSHESPSKPKQNTFPPEDSPAHSTGGKRRLKGFFWNLEQNSVTMGSCEDSGNR